MDLPQDGRNHLLELLQHLRLAISHCLHQLRALILLLVQMQSFSNLLPEIQTLDLLQHGRGNLLQPLKNLIMAIAQGLSPSHWVTLCLLLKQHIAHFCLKIHVRDVLENRCNLVKALQHLCMATLHVSCKLCSVDFELEFRHHRPKLMWQRLRMCPALPKLVQDDGIPLQDVLAHALSQGHQLRRELGALGLSEGVGQAHLLDRLQDLHFAIIHHIPQDGLRFKCCARTCPLLLKVVSSRPLCR
mmetsp:Transcript_131881/g.421957  ORF Transcript_131881/g.421957 Transcript_131881/m.421957 type:complete len:244 (-) Transcript_131881:1391-2122(-)